MIGSEKYGIISEENNSLFYDIFSLSNSILNFIGFKRNILFLILRGGYFRSLMVTYKSLIVSLVNLFVILLVLPVSTIVTIVFHLFGHGGSLELILIKK